MPSQLCGIPNGDKGFRTSLHLELWCAQYLQQLGNVHWAHGKSTESPLCVGKDHPGQKMFSKSSAVCVGQKSKPHRRCSEERKDIVVMPWCCSSRRFLGVQKTQERSAKSWPDKSLYSIFIPCFKAGLECYIFHIGAESFTEMGMFCSCLFQFWSECFPSLLPKVFCLRALTSIVGVSDTTVFKSTVRGSIQQDKLDNFYNHIIITGSIKELLHFFKAMLFLALTLQWHIGWQYPWYYFKIQFNK